MLIITTKELADRIWDRNRDRIEEWIREFIEQYHFEPDYCAFCEQFVIDTDYEVPFDYYLNEMLYISPMLVKEISSRLQLRFDKLVADITKEMVVA